MYFLWVLFTLSIFIVRSATCCCSLAQVLLGGSNTGVDLTIPHNNKTVYFEIVEDKSQTLNVESNNTTNNTSKSIVMLGGTYIESPSAYDEDGATDIPIQTLLVQLIVIDVSSKVNDDPKYVLRNSDIHATIDHEVLQYIEKWPSLVVIKFGWSKYYYDEAKYLGHTGESTVYNFPVVSNEVAEWITSYDNVVGLGVDLPNIERNASEGFAVHKTIAEAGKYVIENLNLTSTLPTHQCTVAALPVRVNGNPRALASVVAVCPKDKDHHSACKAEIDKRDEHEHKPCHTCHKCKHQANHECAEHKHNSTDEEHEHSTHESTTQGNTEPPATQKNKEPPKQENNYKEPPKGPHQQIINSVHKFTDLFNKPS